MECGFRKTRCGQGMRAGGTKSRSTTCSKVSQSGACPPARGNANRLCLGGFASRPRGSVDAQIREAWGQKDHASLSMFSEVEVSERSVPSAAACWISSVSGMLRCATGLPVHSKRVDDSSRSTPTPPWPFPNAPCYRKYGFQTEAVGEWGEGTPIRWTFHLDDGSFTIENDHLSVASHEDALQGAGFRDIRWHPAALAPNAPTEQDQDFWSTLLKSPPLTFIDCVKA